MRRWLNVVPIAIELGRTGQYRSALMLQEQILDALLEDLGTEHPDTLEARHNLAYWTGEAGDTAAARDQLAALLPVVERVLGAEYPHTMSTRHTLAYWTKEAEPHHDLVRESADTY